jgi:DNA-binding MarR family transcriptional regulator
MPTALKLEEYLPYRLSVAAAEVSRLVARAYEDRFGLTIPQWRLIANLAEHGPTTPLQLGRLAALDKVTVSRASQALLERALSRRVENGEDGRHRAPRLGLRTSSDRRLVRGGD